MSEAKTASLVEVQRRVSAVIEVITGLRVVSFDKLEGIDSLRPCFIVDAEISNRSLYMKNWADNEVSVDVFYYGLSSVDCKEMADTLARIFVQPLAIGDVVVVPDNLSAAVQTQYVLAFGMTVAYRSSILTDDREIRNITMGHIPHISDYNDELMEEITMNNDLIKKEEEDGDDQH